MSDLSVFIYKCTNMYFQIFNYQAAQRKRLNVVQGLQTEQAFVKVSEIL